MSSANLNRNASIGLFILRVGTSALLFFGHGWPKLANFAERSQTFSDPLGVGSVASLTLVVFAEFVCAVLVAFGFLTRLAAVPIVIFMLVAVFIQHAADPFSKKELAMIFGLSYLTLVFTGAGRFSFDAWIGRLRGGRGTGRANA